MGEPFWLTTARGYIGTREIVGPKHESRILRWWESIRSSFRDDETPWCAAYVGGVLEECGYRSTRSAAARSYLKWGSALDAPATGCVVVFSRPGNSWSGHVGFVLGKDPVGRLLVLGGNQGNAVSIAPFQMSRVLGYRWPLEAYQRDQFPNVYGPLPVLASFNGSDSTNEA